MRRSRRSRSESKTDAFTPPNPKNPLQSPSGGGLLLLIFALAVIPLLGFWAYGLFDLDEGFYGAVVAEMNRRGEWITPYFLGAPWFEKPILLYWLAKPSVLVFGKALGPRLPSILTTLGLYATCGLYIRKRVSTPAALWTVGILSTSILVVALGRLMTPDAILTLCLTGALLSFFESLVGARSWRLLTALCLGLSVLAKGPIGLVLFAALAIWTYASEKELRPAFRGYWLLGTILLFLTVSSWYLPAYLENGQVFVQKFLVEQNLQRFGGGDEAHKVPIVLWPIYFPVILFVGMLPWSFFVPAEWVRSLKGDATPLQHYLARWAVIVLIFFTISGTKLPHYILPAIPPLAMLIAISFAERRAFSWAAIAAMACAVFVIVHGAFVLYYGQSGFAELDKLALGINRSVSRPALVVAYELGRTDNDGPGPLGLNLTANPSLAFYVDDPDIRVIEVPKKESGAPFEQLRAVLTANSYESIVVVTRPKRISIDQMRQLDANREALSIDHSGKHYVVYKHYSLVMPPRPPGPTWTTK